MSKKKMMTFLKWIVICIELHGISCITCSYIMAFMGKADVLENLSSTIVGEIVAPMLTYGITKTIENIFEKNNIFKNKGDDING